MEKYSLGKKAICNLLVMSFIASSCMSSDIPTSSPKATIKNSVGSTTSGNNNGAGADNSSLGSGTTLPPKVEIRHLIEPNLSTDPNYSPGTGQKRIQKLGGF